MSTRGTESFASRLDGAWEWWSAATEEAQEGRWIRDPVERQGMADIEAATNALTDGRPAPFTDDSRPARTGRIANGAGVIRLTARAGGWRPRPVVGHRPPHPDGVAAPLPGIHAVGEQGEYRTRRLRAGETAHHRDVSLAEAFGDRPGIHRGRPTLLPRLETWAERARTRAATRAPGHDAAPTGR
ncbi:MULTISPECIES: hypothetical protein [Streptomyces]|uniref:Uncharacterized protein n=1 Tax=Streptomyces changanensis TaxID=2964669 RepID=A0ABY5NEJ8_9ACTN|nr:MULTISPECIES: hypothetical protein [Streptomyces]UUS34366.1 hypothetical protein NRO40_28400 [Streptomyces changanensis]